MRKSDNRGFSIIELVIVIAVIAILAAVLIPTFSGIINKSNASAIYQEVMAEYKEAFAIALADGKLEEGGEIAKMPEGKYEFTFTMTGEEITCVITDNVYDGFFVSYENGDIKVVKE